MIKNERQNRITKSQADKFAEALSSLRSRHGRRATRSKASWTNCEINSKTTNDFKPVRVMKSFVDSFDELPLALVKARIALSLSGKDLAERTGMKEQQIQH